MTREQGTVSVSVAVASTIMAVVVIIISTINREYMRDYVSKSIHTYDSIVVRSHINEYNTTIRNIEIDSDSSLQVNKEVLKLLQQWNNQ